MCILWEEGINIGYFLLILRLFIQCNIWKDLNYQNLMTMSTFQISWNFQLRQTFKTERWLETKKSHLENIFFDIGAWCLILFLFILCEFLYNFDIWAKKGWTERPDLWESEWWWVATWVRTYFMKYYFDLTCHFIFDFGCLCKIVAIWMLEINQEFILSLSIQIFNHSL